MQKLFKFFSQRLLYVIIDIIVTITAMVFIIVKFNEFFVYYYTISVVLSIIIVVLIVNSKRNPGYKIAWIILVLLFPIFGGLFFLLFGGNKLSRRIRRTMNIVDQRTRESLPKNDALIEILKQQNKDAAAQSTYIQNYAYSPPYVNTVSTYLASGEDKFQHLLEELKKAEYYIFLEYYIIAPGVMWDSVLEILVQKVNEGVDVRVIYDDFGSITTLPYRYDKQLENLGIKACIFNPMKPILSIRMNNRDHRKIAVIDGHTGFTGGVNLADEYINLHERFGHWKDSAIMLKGEAVWSLTVMFLSMWEYITGKGEDYNLYKPHLHCPFPIESDGYVQPYADSPYDEEPTGETVYLNLINRAKKYIYICTPYLIVDHGMITALCVAAKSGIDVRILTPGVPDKQMIHALTKSYYKLLLAANIKIYEYTPGFVHAKSFVVDDEYATVGSINLDYRSLYLHFECGVWLYHTQSILPVKNDFLNALLFCHQYTMEDYKKTHWFQRFIRAFLRIIAPLV